MTASTRASALTKLAQAEAACKRCPLYKDATQVVPGEGPFRAHFMFVGEQPGDREDVAGKPFVGPAGRILDAALKDAGISRKDAFVTNAVKHFKHEMRGKRRLHKRPNNHEIERCTTWLTQEVEAVRPSVIVALGVTAARGLTGKTVTISKVRGAPVSLPNGSILTVTIHPSALLRIKNEAEKRVSYNKVVTDLKAARKMAWKTASKTSRDLLRPV